MIIHYFNPSPLTIIIFQQQICGGIWVVLGLGTLIGGFIAPPMVQKVYEYGVEKNQELSVFVCEQGDDGWKAFEKTEKNQKTKTKKTGGGKN